MNTLTGNITQILQSGAILLVDVDVDGQCFSALLIESIKRPAWLYNGNTIDLLFKETEVSLARDLKGLISIRNRMMCTVIRVESGELLSKITLQFQKNSVVSVITTRAVNSLNISPGDEIEAMVKANEISLRKK